MKYKPKPQNAHLIFDMCEHSYTLSLCSSLCLCEITHCHSAPPKITLIINFRLPMIRSWTDLLSYFTLHRLAGPARVRFISQRATGRASERKQRSREGELSQLLLLMFESNAKNTFITIQLTCKLGLMRKGIVSCIPRTAPT